MKKFSKVLSFVLVLLGFAVLEGKAQSEFDYVGKIHNEVLQEFVNQNKGKKLTISQVLASVKELTLANEDYKSRFGTKVAEITESQVKEGMLEYTNKFAGFISKLKVSNEAKSKLTNLMTFMYKSKDTKLSYMQIKDFLLAYDAEIKASSLAQEEKNIIFQINSVAKSSSKFWLEISADNDSRAAVWADIGGGIFGIFFGGGWAIPGFAIGASAIALNEK